jgi:hypothetical protein
MLKVNVKTIKRHDKSDDLAVSFRDKNVTFGEYIALLKFAIDGLKQCNEDIDVLKTVKALIK